MVVRRWSLVVATGFDLAKDEGPPTND